MDCQVRVHVDPESLDINLPLFNIDKSSNIYSPVLVTFRYFEP